MTAEELEVEVKAIIAQVGAAGPKDMGKVMGVASKALAGKAEGRAISETVKRLLNSWYLERIELSRSRAWHGIAKAQTVSYMYLLILPVLLRPRVKHGDKIAHFW